MRVNTRYINSTRSSSSGCIPDVHTFMYISLNSNSALFDLMEFMYLVSTRMPVKRYLRRLTSLLLYLCYVFRALINSLVCWFYTSALGLVLFQIFLCGSYISLKFKSVKLGHFIQSTFKSVNVRGMIHHFYQHEIKTGHAGAMQYLGQHSSVAVWVIPV